MPSAPMPINGMYVWQGAPEYKNQLLAYYQRALKKHGVTNREHVKQLVMQIVQENGALNPLVRGADCEIGIPQRQIAGCRITQFLNQNPEWRTAEAQLDWLADRVGILYKEYDGDIRRTIVHHNRPQSAIHNKVYKECNGVDSYRHLSSRGWSCYYEDEIMQHAEVVVLSN